MKKTVAVRCHEREVVGVTMRDHMLADIRKPAHAVVRHVRVLIKRGGVLFEAKDAVCPKQSRAQ